MCQVGAGATAGVKEATAGTMGGPAQGDAKAAEESDQPDAAKADDDLDRLAKKDPDRFKKAVRVTSANCGEPLSSLTTLCI